MKKIAFMTTLLVFSIFLFSCMTASVTISEGPKPVKKKAPSAKVYQGSGKSSSLIEAISLAKMDAVRKAVIEMIGVANEQANRDRLEEVLYNSSNPNAFILTDTYKTTRKDKIGGDYVIECEVAVNLDAVRSTLKANGILAGEPVTGERKTETAGEQSRKETAAGAAKINPPPAEKITPEERRIIEEYVNNMTYMVYFNEKSKEDPFYMKAAVSIANEYLASHSLAAAWMPGSEAGHDGREHPIPGEASIFSSFPSNMHPRGCRA